MALTVQVRWDDLRVTVGRNTDNPDSLDDAVSDCARLFRDAVETLRAAGVIAADDTASGETPEQ